MPAACGGAVLTPAGGRQDGVPEEAAGLTLRGEQKPKGERWGWAPRHGGSEGSGSEGGARSVSQRQPDEAGLSALWEVRPQVKRGPCTKRFIWIYTRELTQKLFFISSLKFQDIISKVSVLSLFKHNQNNVLKILTTLQYHIIPRQYQIYICIRGVINVFKFICLNRDLNLVHVLRPAPIFLKPLFVPACLCSLITLHTSFYLIPTISIFQIRQKNRRM